MRGEGLGKGALVLLAAACLAGCAAGPRPGQAKAAPAPRPPLAFAQDPYPSTYRPLPRTDTLIRHVTLLDGAGRRFEDADLLLTEGRVAAVGANLTAPAGAVVLDGHGRWVTPGVIDIHTHNGNFPAPFTSLQLEHSDVSEISDPNTANVWAEHSILTQDPAFSRALAGGVTTLQVLPGSDPLFGGRSVVLKNVPAATVQAMKFPGAQQGLKMACGENPEYYFGDKGRFPSSRMGNFAGYREAWIKAAAYKHKWEAYQRGEAKDPPDRDLKLDTLAAVLNGDIRVQMHCYRAEEMAYVIDLSKEFGYHVAAFHHAAEAYKIPDLLAKEGICAVVWSDWWGYKVEAFDGIRENAAFVDAAGACVTMHSDSNIIGQRLTVEAGKAMAAGRRAGLAIAPEHAIQWVTLNPAKAMGLDRQIGSLEAGKNADVVIWSGDPFSIYSHADQVFIDGALVFDRFDPHRQPLSDFELGRPSSGHRP
ncbi:MAG: amidohydrolase [Phenylobacterium sp.]|jgi:imidazolonepropionase-like amidohydrolase|nr:amidohydrolase [Phenylobacterium sp.]